MKRILSVFTLLTFLFVLNQFTLAGPANPVLLKDVKITPSGDSTRIELIFDGKPGSEKVLYRDDFIQLELPETYTDPPKQWLKVEDKTVKNIFLYQFDTNTVRVRLFTYDKSAGLRGRVSITKANNSIVIGYNQKTAVPVSRTASAKKTRENSVVKKDQPEADLVLPSIVETESTPPETDLTADAQETQDNIAGGETTAASVQTPSGSIGEDHVVQEKEQTNASGIEGLAPSNNQPGFTGSVIKMVTALGIVLSLLFVIVYFVKKYLGRKIGLSGTDQKIKVVTSTYLGPKKSIALVEIGGEKIVVGVTATNISMLTKMGRDEEFVEILKEELNPEPKNEELEIQKEHMNPETENEEAEIKDDLWEKV